MDHVRRSGEGCTHHRRRHRDRQGHRAALRAGGHEARPQRAGACADRRQSVRNQAHRWLLRSAGRGGRDRRRRHRHRCGRGRCRCRRGHVRADGGALRPGRCRGQRGRRDHRPPDRGDERGGVGQHHGRERQGHVPREQGGGHPDAHARGGRADHQHFIGCGKVRHGDPLALLRVQVRGHRLLERARQGGRARGHHGQLHLPRHRGHADVDPAQRRLRGAGGDAGAGLCPRHRALHSPGHSADRGRHGPSSRSISSAPPMSPARPSISTAARLL